MKPEICVILAIARDGAIGHDGDLLWHLPADLRHFKQLTMGHPVIMGRRTWESLPKGALPGRRNIVVTRNPAFEAPGAEVAGSEQEALGMCEGAPRVYIIGGARLYESTLPLAGKLLLTRVEAVYPEADTRMPDPSLSPGMELVEASGQLSDERSGLSFRFETYVRKVNEDSDNK